MIYADIIVDISHEKVDRSFQYKVPEELQHKLQVGMVVTIPFGSGNHERKGYVIGLSEDVYKRQAVFCSGSVVPRAL